MLRTILPLFLENERKGKDKENDNNDRNNGGEKGRERMPVGKVLDWTFDHHIVPKTSENMMDDLRTDFCELGFMELVDYVIEFLGYRVENAVAIKSLNRMWRFVAMMAGHWEGAIFCGDGCHMLLNPTKLQKANAEKDAWCCTQTLKAPFGMCDDFCTCNIPKCLKSEDELEEKIGGFPAFEFLAIDFGIPHLNEIHEKSHSALRPIMPVIHSVYFASWPQDDVVAIRFPRGCNVNHDHRQINNVLLQRFGPRNLRLFVAAKAPIASTSLKRCTKLKWLDVYNAASFLEAEHMGVLANLPQLAFLSLDQCKKVKPLYWQHPGDFRSLEGLSLLGVATDEIVDTILTTLQTRKATQSAGISPNEEEDKGREKEREEEKEEDDDAGEKKSKAVTKKLRFIDCSASRISEATLVRLGEPYPDDIETLCLRGGYTRVGGLGGSGIAKMRNIKHLDLRFPNKVELSTLARAEVVDDGALFTLSENFRHLVSLKLGNEPQSFTGKGLAAIASSASVSTLRCFHLFHCGSAIDADAFAAIGAFTKLEVLVLSGLSSVERESFAFVQHLPNLRALSLLGEESLRQTLNDDVLHHLFTSSAATLPRSLTKLSLRGNQGVTGVGLAHLAILTALESLDISGTCCDDAALEHIAKLTKLRWLSCGSDRHWVAPGLHDDGLKHLRRLTNLEYLSLAGIHSVTPDGVFHCIETMDYLTLLDVTNTKCDKTSLQRRFRPTDFLRTVREWYPTLRVNSWAEDDGCGDYRR